MKAGILEWPDIFFVNKADLGDAADRTAAELRSGLELSTRRDASRPPPVLCGSARDGIGIDALIEALDEHARSLRETKRLAERRRAGRLARVRNALLSRYGRLGLAHAEDTLQIDAFVASHSEVSVDRIVDELGGAVEQGFARNAR
jgi:LAO/AO transport system kinase